MDPDLRFFFGSTSRPVMIKLNYEFTLFDAEFDDCTGLHLMRDDLDAHAGLNLRSPKEICGLASWLGSLKPPALADGESIQLSVVGQFENNFTRPIDNLARLWFNLRVLNRGRRAGRFPATAQSISI